MESQARNNTPYFTQKSGRGGGRGDADEGDNNLAKAVNSDERARALSSASSSSVSVITIIVWVWQLLTRQFFRRSPSSPLSISPPRVEARDGLIANQQGYL